MVTWAGAEMLGSWRAEGACGGGCLPGVEGADSLCASDPPSAWLESGRDLAVSALGGGGTGIERGVGVGVLCTRASVDFLAADGFSGELSSMMTLQLVRTWGGLSGSAGCLWGCKCLYTIYQRARLTPL